MAELEGNHIVVITEERYREKEREKEQKASSVIRNGCDDDASRVKMEWATGICYQIFFSNLNGKAVNWLTSSMDFGFNSLTSLNELSLTHKNIFY